MAERKIVIDLAIETANAANSVRDIKSSLKELRDVQLQYGEGTEEFTKAATKAGELKDRLNAVNDSLRNLSNSPVENVKNSFGTLSTQLRTLDFGGAKQSLKDLGASSSVLVKGILGLGPGVNTATVAFRGLGAAIAATGIGALAIAIGVVVQNFDKIKESGGALGDIFKFVGDTINSVKTAILELLVQFGLIDKAVLEDTESQKEYKKAIDETKKSVDDLTLSLDNEVAVLGKTGAEREKILLDQEINAKKRELLSIDDATLSLQLYTEYQQLASKGIQNLTAQEKFRFEEIAKTDYFSIGKKVQEDLDKIEQIRTAKIKEINKKAAEETQKARDEAKKKAEKEKEDTLKQLEKEFKAENDADQKRADEEFKILKEKNAKILAEEEKQAAELIALLTKEIQDAADAQANADNEARRKRIEAREDTIKSLQSIGNAFKQTGQEINSSLLFTIGTVTETIGTFVELSNKVFEDNNEKILAYTLATVDALTSIYGNIVNTRVEKNKELLNEQLDDLETATNREESELERRRKNGQISEEQYQQGLFKIKLKAFKEEERLKKQIFEEDKKAKIAAATIAGFQGAISAYVGAQSLPLPPPAPQIIGGIAAAAVLGFTANNIAKIRATQYKSGTPPESPGGGEGGSTGGALPTALTEQTQQTPTPELLGIGNTNANNLGTPITTIRAVVVESDITSAQVRIQNFETSAQLGNDE